jgi:hypothetical protein
MRLNDHAPDLAEYVSDYWTIYRENGGKRPTAKEIAAAYCEAAIADDADRAEYDAAVAETAPQITYYLPAR